jgi:hypothetical protein
MGGTVSTGGSFPHRCGDGTVDPGEQCDLGAGNADFPAFLVTQAGVSFAATPLSRIPSVSDFYNYTSSAAHTGLETLGTSYLTLYVEKATRTLSLVALHGIDSNTSGQEQPASEVQIVFSGLPETTTVAVSDDPGELTMTSTTSATGKWRFSANTDGGALSNLTFPGDWEIYVSPAFVQGISAWTWLKGDGSSVTLDLTQPLTIKAHASPASCRLNCTLPHCGDGILDGGEICDGGSTSVGNECATYCMSFN